MTRPPPPPLPRETCLQGSVSGDGKESGTVSPPPLKAPRRRDPTPGSHDHRLRTLWAGGRGAGWSQPSGANCYQLPELDRVEDGILGVRELGWETSHLLFSQCVLSRPAMSDSLRPHGL